MIDLLKNFGDDINIDKLSKEIGFDIVEVSALKGTGVLEVATKAVELAKRKEKLFPYINSVLMWRGLYPR